MTAEQIDRIEEAQVLKTAGLLTAQVMDLFASACLAAGEAVGEQFWSGRAAGMRFAVQRVLRRSEAGESPAVILLGLGDVGEKVASTDDGPFTRGWVRGIEEVCRAVFRTGLAPLP